MKRPLWIAVVMVVVGTVVPARAGGPAPAGGQGPAAAPNEAQARQHFQRGSTLSQHGQYKKAFEEFSAGYRLSRRPVFLFNMAECARLGGDPAQARAYYERYLREDPHGALVKEARDRLAEVNAALTAAPPPHAAVPAPAPPVAAPPVAASPPHPSTPTAPAPSLAVPMTAPAPALDLGVAGGEPPPARPPFWKRWPFWTGVGAAVVAATVTTIALTRGGGSTTPAGDLLIDARR